MMLAIDDGADSGSTYEPLFEPIIPDDGIPVSVAPIVTDSGIVTAPPTNDVPVPMTSPVEIQPLPVFQQPDGVPTTPTVVSSPAVVSPPPANDPNPLVGSDGGPVLNPFAPGIVMALPPSILVGAPAPVDLPHVTPNGVVVPQAVAQQPTASDAGAPSAAPGVVTPAPVNGTTAGGLTPAAPSPVAMAAVFCVVLYLLLK